ncbi:amidohydrolase [Tsukamurella pseudospumae]|uniref:Peptidase M20 domain-containing protein 2 n=1 Tax=Tsukamurella pseudospumae TaxID=239498 RepID=A0A137YZ83_9ACTN|nr:amidohydrolase [Tsukamurella pseudospumae]KXO91254.1 peptidase M20 [Tsukamurella pseudospumae]
MTVTTDLPAAAAATVAAEARTLLDLSHDLHDHPELSFEEVRSAALLANLFEARGFAVERGAHGVDTAFTATLGTGEVHAVLCAEYDALPGLGHACGHNVIAGITTGAALALAPLVDELGITLTVLGTPAEEHGGGKVELLRAGAFETATLAAMVHPINGDGVTEVAAADATMQCVDRFDVLFQGRSAHAAAAPDHAINAESAAVLAQTAIGLLRQHVPDGVRLAVVSNSAGRVTNIVPAQARLSAEVRSADLDQMLDIKRRLLACFEGAAIATGCEWEHHRAEPRYLSITPEVRLAEAWNAAVTASGRTVVTGPTGGGGGSTDMGNVSRVVPSIHPMLSIADAAGPPHTIEFAAAARTAQADATVLDGATILARTIIDVASDPEARTVLLRRQAERPEGATMIDQNAD